MMAAVELYPEIPVALHQDHGNSPATCISAIEQGFTSVMMDGSLEEDAKTPASYEYNVAVTREVVNIAHRFGCNAYGSDSLLTLMRLHGLAEQTVEVEPYRTYELGPFEVSFTPSVHSKLLLGLAVPYDGDLTCEHLDGLTPGAYRCGQVWGISIRVAGVSFYHQGSANLIDEAVRERGIDVFLAGVAGRNFTDDYWRRIIPRLDPKVVVPTHYDNFFRPLGQRLEFVSDVRLSALPEEIGAVSRDLEIAAIPRADLSP